jgi:hypothetical protein
MFMHKRDALHVKKQYLTRCINMMRCILKKQYLTSFDLQIMFQLNSSPVVTDYCSKIFSIFVLE